MICGEKTQKIKVEMASSSRNIKLLIQSPDMSSTEGYWNIVEQEMRRRLVPSEKDVNGAIQDEWSRLSKWRNRTASRTCLGDKKGSRVMVGRLPRLQSGRWLCN